MDGACAPLPAAETPLRESAVHGGVPVHVAGDRNATSPGEGRPSQPLLTPKKHRRSRGRRSPAEVAANPFVAVGAVQAADDSTQCTTGAPVSPWTDDSVAPVGLAFDDDDFDDVASECPPSTAGLPRRGGRGGKGGGRGGKGGRAAGNSREFRLPPPPSSASLKVLPPDQVSLFLQSVRSKDFPEALKDLRRLRRSVKGRGCTKEEFGAVRALLHHLLEGYGAYGRVQDVIAVLTEMKTGAESRLVSVAAFNAVIRGHLALGRLDDARFVVRQEMPRLGVVPNESSLNLLMDAAARHGRSSEAWDVLEEMLQRSLKADKYTVSILTKGISDRAGGNSPPRVARAISLVELFLKTQAEDVDEVLVNSILDVFCRMGDLTRLEATLQRMRELGIKGSAVTYGTMVKAYGQAGNIEKVFQAWAEMSRVGLEANSVTYGCMLDACVKCGHIDKAFDVFSLMKEQGLHRNTILYATLIKGFAKSKDPLAARRLYREMLSEGVPCNVVVFNSLIDACVRSSDLHAAAEVLQEMTMQGVQPDLITFSTLIKGYCSSGELGKAMRLAEELQARNLECDEIMYNSLLEGCVKAGDLNLGMQIFTDMQNRGTRPSGITFTIMVKLLSRAGRLDMAIELVSTMRELHGLAPTRMVWSCLVTSCVKSRDLQRAVAVLDYVDREGHHLDNAWPYLYGTVIEGALGSGEAALAVRLCDRAAARRSAGSRGSLAPELLRRVYEAAAGNGAADHAAIDASPGTEAAAAKDSSPSEAAASAAAANSAAAAASAWQWHAALCHAQGDANGAGAAAAAAAGFMGLPWDAAAAAAANGGGGALPGSAGTPWPSPWNLDAASQEGFPGAGMPGFADYSGAWAQCAAWQAGMQWALEAAGLAQQSPGLGWEQPEAPCSPEAAGASNGTPGATSVGKALQRTPPTTVGDASEAHSLLLERSPYDDTGEQANAALQTRLFAGEPCGGTPPAGVPGPHAAAAGAGDGPLLRPPGLA